MEKHKRVSGILLHPSSLPGDFGIGNFGSEAYKFVDYLKNSGQTLWQILPLGPTGPGDSPYQSFSAFALNPLLIDLQTVADDGWLNSEELTVARSGNSGMVDYGEVNSVHHELLHTAFHRFKTNAGHSAKEAFTRFCTEQWWWLKDYSLFMAIKEYYGGIAWYEWPEAIRRRKPSSLALFRTMLAERAEYRCFLQFLGFTQWMNLKHYANHQHVRIVGDIPLYISFDSSDAWADPSIFMLDKKLKPLLVAGVPPDFFSEDGQLWGNPVYNWEVHQRTHFKWWQLRMEYNFKLADILRIDHFRGLAAYWAVPFGSKNAVNGEWIEAPGAQLFEALNKANPHMEVIAEDLGYITPEVDELRERFRLPGMKILQFGFDHSQENMYAPHNYAADSAVYTGTHDNNTIVGWFNELDEEVKHKLHDYLGSNSRQGIHWQMIRMAMASVSQYCIIPAQDLLGAGAEARMNIPGTASGNWRWRLHTNELTHEISHKLSRMVQLYDR